MKSSENLSLEAIKALKALFGTPKEKKMAAPKESDNNSEEKFIKDYVKRYKSNETTANKALHAYQAFIKHDYTEAKTYAFNAFTECPNDEESKLIFVKAIMRRQDEDNYAAAIEQLSLLVQNDLENDNIGKRLKRPQLVLWIAQLLKTRGHIDLAKTKLQLLMHFDEAKFWREEEEAESRKKMRELIVTLEPQTTSPSSSNKSTLIRMGNDAFEAKNFFQAINYYNQAVKLEPFDFKSYAKRAEARLKIEAGTQDVNLTIKCLEEAMYDYSIAIWLLNTQTIGPNDVLQFFIPYLKKRREIYVTLNRLQPSLDDNKRIHELYLIAFGLKAKHQKPRAVKEMEKQLARKKEQERNEYIEILLKKASEQITLKSKEASGYLESAYVYFLESPEPDTKKHREFHECLISLFEAFLKHFPYLESCKERLRFLKEEQSKTELKQEVTASEITPQESKSATKKRKRVKAAKEPAQLANAPQSQEPEQPKSEEKTEIQTIAKSELTQQEQELQPSSNPEPEAVAKESEKESEKPNEPQETKSKQTQTPVVIIEDPKATQLAIDRLQKQELAKTAREQKIKAQSDELKDLDKQIKEQAKTKTEREAKIKTQVEELNKLDQQLKEQETQKKITKKQFATESEKMTQTSARLQSKLKKLAQEIQSAETDLKNKEDKLAALTLSAKTTEEASKALEKKNEAQTQPATTLKKEIHSPDEQSKTLESKNQQPSQTREQQIKQLRTQFTAQLAEERKSIYYKLIAKYKLSNPDISNSELKARYPHLDYMTFRPLDPTTRMDAAFPYLESALDQDFTSETVMRDKTNGIHDPLLCGLDDIAANRIRTILPPELAFQENPMRIFRVFYLTTVLNKVMAPELQHFMEKFCFGLSRIFDLTIPKISLQKHIGELHAWLTKTLTGEAGAKYFRALVKNNDKPEFGLFEKILPTLSYFIERDQDWICQMLTSSAQKISDIYMIFIVSRLMQSNSATLNQFYEIIQREPLIKIEFDKMDLEAICTLFAATKAKWKEFHANIEQKQVVTVKPEDRVGVSAAQYVPAVVNSAVVNPTVANPAAVKPAVVNSASFHSQAGQSLTVNSPTINTTHNLSNLPNHSEMKAFPPLSLTPGTADYHLPTNSAWRKHHGWFKPNNRNKSVVQLASRKSFR